MQISTEFFLSYARARGSPRLVACLCVFTVIVHANVHGTRYFSNLITSPRASELMFSIVISKSFVCALDYFLLSAIIGRSVGLSSDFTGVEDSAARGVLLSPSEGVNHFAHFVEVFRILSDSTSSPVKAYLVYSRLLIQQLTDV